MLKHDQIYPYLTDDKLTFNTKNDFVTANDVSQQTAAAMELAAPLAFRGNTSDITIHGTGPHPNENPIMYTTMLVKESQPRLSAVGDTFGVDVGVTASTTFMSMSNIIIFAELFGLMSVSMSSVNL